MTGKPPAAGVESQQLHAVIRTPAYLRPISIFDLDNDYWVVAGVLIPQNMALPWGS